MNPTKKKTSEKKKTKKSGAKKSHAKKSHTKKSHGKKHHGKKSHGKKTTRRRSSSRRRNPGFDGVGLLAAMAGGAVGRVAAVPAAHYAGKLATNKDHPEKGEGMRVAAQVGGAAAVAALGAGVSMFAPNIGKGIAASAAGEMVAKPLEHFSVGEKGPTFLAHMGFGTLELPDGSKVFRKDGVLYKQPAADGQDPEVLFGFTPRAAELEYDDRTEPVSLLGDVPGGVLYQRSNGQLALLPDTTIGDIIQVGDLVAVSEQQSPLGDLIAIPK